MFVTFNDIIVICFDKLIRCHGLRCAQDALLCLNTIKIEIVLYTIIYPWEISNIRETTTTNSIFALNK